MKFLKSCSGRVSLNNPLSLIIQKKDLIHKLQFPDLTKKDLTFLVQNDSYFGKGKNNFLDQPYHKTSEFLPHEILLNPCSIENVLNDAIYKTSSQLTSNQHIKAQLNKLNVYSEGGFFKDHVDIPKQNSFGSLVVFLPSPFKGGQLVIKQTNDSKLYDFSQAKKEEVSWVSFYNDSIQQIKPILQGHRLTLLYDLFIEQLPNVSSIVSSRLQKKVKSMQPGKRYGFFCQNYYPQCTTQFLKGQDRQFYRLVKDEFDIQFNMYYKIGDKHHFMQSDCLCQQVPINLLITVNGQGQQRLQHKQCKVQKWLNDPIKQNWSICAIEVQAVNYSPIERHRGQLYMELIKK